MRFFSPLEIGTLIQTPEVEMFEEKAAIGQVEKICEGNLLHENGPISPTSSQDTLRA